MKNNYIRHALCLRNSIAYGHDFWYTCVKWWYLRVFFSLFWNFHFSGCVEGKKTKNSPKWKTAITSLTHHISGTVWHIIMIFGTLVWNDDISRRFFHCFEIFIVQAVTGGGGGGEQYSIWSWFLRQLCKIMISPGVFSSFLWSFYFLGC